MSANRGRAGAPKAARLAAALALLALQCAPLRAGEWAADAQNVLITPFADPLQSRPDTLDNGARLPGDPAALACPASDRPPSPLGLSDAVNAALCRNPQLKSAWVAIKLQAAVLGEARAAYLPTASLTASRLRTRTTFDEDGRDSTSVMDNTLYGTLSWRLFDFGTRAANRQSANSQLLAAMENHDAAMQRTLTATIQAFFDAQSARAAWQAKEQSEALARDTLESASRREAKGAVARSDTLQASTALARAGLERSRALGNYRKSLALLVYLMGLPPESEIALTDEDGGDAGQDALAGDPGGADLNSWLRDAQQSHPAIAAARARWQAAQDKVGATRAEGLPTVDVSANYYQNGYPGQALSQTRSHINTIGISVTFPIFDGFSRTYKVRQAQARAEQSETELINTEQNIAMEVVKAHADAQSSLQNLAASRTLLSAAEEALATSQRKYDKGAADILEILNTQAALNDARQERIRCVAEWRSARLRLMASAGKLGMLPIHSNDNSRIRPQGGQAAP